MARVVTGFSKPYVALFGMSGDAISYTSGQVLAHGVDVSISPNTSGDNVLYADNMAVESVSGMFTGGTFSLTVDGLSPDAYGLIMGLPEADSEGWVAFDEDQAVPYVGLGYIVRYMSGGVTKYQPYVLAKVSFDQVADAAATQGEEIDWQTQALSGTILRAQDAKKTWKYVGNEFDTEALAEAALKAKLGIS